MANMDEMKRQLFQKFPFMKKQGKIIPYLEMEEFFRSNCNEKLLVLVVGVQGAGKTTFCKQYPAERVINFDQILQEIIDRGNAPKSLPEINKIVNTIGLERIKEKLREGIAIVDGATVRMAYRVFVLNELKDEYTKVALVVLNPPLNTIINQICNQPERFRTNLWEEVEQEYHLLQMQKDEHLLEMGVDYVSYVKLS